jgi:nicotinamidase-related amidase
MKAAIIVVDMLHDFVRGALKCERAERIVPNLQKLVVFAREKRIPVIYSNDAHLKEIDGEFKLWGPHAIDGDAGAQVVEELKPLATDFVVKKRRYSGFFETDLDLLLRELNVDTLILTGLHTHLCVRHTAADAYFRGFRLIVPEDAVEAFTKEDHESGLEYLKRNYGAEITTVDSLLEHLTEFST